MNVKFLHSIASNDFSYRPGEVANIPEELAKKWEVSGICEIVKDPKAKEEPKKVVPVGVHPAVKPESVHPVVNTHPATSFPVPAHTTSSDITGHAHIVPATEPHQPSHQPTHETNLPSESREISTSKKGIDKK